MPPGKCLSSRLRHSPGSISTILTPTQPDPTQSPQTPPKPNQINKTIRNPTMRRAACNSQMAIINTYILTPSTSLCFGGSQAASRSCSKDVFHSTHMKIKTPPPPKKNTIQSVTL